jgi:Beta-propeller repeat
MRRELGVGMLVVLFGIAAPCLASEGGPARLDERYGKLPLGFEPNQGQAAAAVQFLARGRSGTVYLAGREVVLTLAAPGGAPASSMPPSRPPAAGAEAGGQAGVLHLRFAGAAAHPVLTGLDPLPGTSNYFIGNDPARWHTGVPTFSRVRAQGLYPGIDVVFYGNERQLEYDLVVAPGADLRRVRLTFAGTEPPRVDGGGNLVLRGAVGELRQLAPVVYQQGADGRRHGLRARYVRRGRSTVGFEVAGHDRTRALVLDPVLVYSTYLGGSKGDTAGGIAVDGSGSAYVTGGTLSLDFPTAGNPRQRTLPTSTTFENAFVSKLSADGSALIYSTYLGGSGVSVGDYHAGDYGSAIAVDGAGNAYVTGLAISRDFPVAGSPVQPKIADASNCICGDAFVAKLDPGGSTLVYSTYLGGSNPDAGSAIAVDSSGHAFVAGYTASPDFRTAGQPLQPAYHGPAFTGSGALMGDGFVAKLDPSGSALVYSTFLGGSGGDFVNGVAVDAAGNAYVTGATASSNFPTAGSPLQRSYGGGSSGGSGDAFVAKVDAAGSALVYSTFLGGSGDDAGEAISIDGAGNAYVTGYTRSTNFPIAGSPLQGKFAGGASFGDDTFVAKLNPAGSALVYSTYLGGSGDESGYGIAVDGAGNAYVTGHTNSTNFPQVSPVQGGYGGASPGSDPFGDAFVAKLNPTGSALVYSSWLGGSADDVGNGIAIDGAGNAYVAGETFSSNFPTAGTPYQKAYHGGDGFDGDAFIAKVAAAGTRCAANDTTLCFDGGRFSVTASYQAPGGQPGAGHAVALTGESGYFWFFASTNVEAFIKVIDGCILNGHFWVFDAGLTNVKATLTVIDGQTGVARSYSNPQRTPFQPSQDTSAFSCAGHAGLAPPETAAGDPVLAEPTAAGTAASTLDDAIAAGQPGGCTANANTLCLNGSRFAVTASFRTSAGQTGKGTAVTLTADTGYFWFFDPTNVEEVVKVLNGCGLGGDYWVFAGGLTNVQVTTVVDDTRTGKSKTYQNPLGKIFQPVQDTQALPVCP